MQLFNKTPRKTLEAFLVLADQIGDANLIQEICMMLGLRQEVAREPVVVSLHPRGKAIFSCRPRA